MLNLLLISLLLPFVVAWLLTAAWIRVAPRLRLVDRPSPRKTHALPTPTAGGVAVVAALLCTVIVLPLVTTLDSSAFVSWNNAVWLPALAVAALGFIDDLRPLPWAPRLAIHFLAAAAAVFRMPPD